MKGSRAAWIAGPVLVAAWTVLGFFYADSAALTWLPKWSLASSVLAPLAFVAVYTVQGLLGPGKWWQTDVGTNLVWLLIAVICGNGLITWAVLFNNGLINTPGMAWAFVGGKFAEALIICWRSVIWMRGYRKESPLITRLRELEAEVAKLRGGPAG
jgi:hypothetical protein